MYILLVRFFLLLIHILRILKTPESLDPLKKFILIKVWQVLQEGFILNYAVESAWKFQSTSWDVLKMFQSAFLQFKTPSILILHKQAHPVHTKL